MVKSLSLIDWRYHSYNGVRTNGQFRVPQLNSTKLNSTEKNVKIAQFFYQSRSSEHFEN